MAAHRVIALLDTNILIARSSATERPVDISDFSRAFVSSISWAELIRGIHATTELSEFKLRLARLDAARKTFGEGLGFDDDCVAAYDRILARVTTRGADPKAHMLERMIAATAIVHDMTVVTRDASGFAGLEGLVDVAVR